MAFITETAIPIKNKYVWGSLRAVGFRYRLRLPIVKIRACQMLVLCLDLHLFETVADVGGIQFIDPDCRRIIRLNRNHSYAAVLVICRKLGDSTLVHLRDWTMIAGEHHDKDCTGR